MTCRCTIKCPTLPTNARGITPDEAKTMDRTQLGVQSRINDNFNKIANELGDIIQSKLQGADITWCKDGYIVLSAEDTLENVENCIKDLKLQITTDRSEIRHKVRTLPDGTQEEDIDEVLEQDETKQRLKLKSRKVTNKFKEYMNKTTSKKRGFKKRP